MDRDIHSLDVRLLLAFDALARERSVTRAAARLGVTQQGLSGQLARMRALFGDPLFVREGSGVSPTPRADMLAPQIRAVLAGMRGLVETAAFAPAAFDGVVSVAASDYAVAVVLPPLLLALRAQAPRLRLAVRPLQSATLEQDMRERRIDFALSVPQFTPTGLRSHRMIAEHYLGAVRCDHPLAQGYVDLDRFCAFPHLLVSPDKGDFHGPTDTALALVGRARDVAVVVPSFAVAAGILEATDLVAVLPARLLSAAPRRLHVFAPPVAVVGFDLHGFWPERLHADAMHLWFREICFGCLRGMAWREAHVSERMSEGDKTAAARVS